MTREPTFGELEDGLQIDKNALDDNLQAQAELFYHVSRTTEQLISDRDAAKQHLEETKARVDLQLRRERADSGEKVTDKLMESLVICQKDVVEAAHQYHQIKSRLGVYTALTEAYRQRSFAMGKLSDLYAASYFNHVATDRALGDYKTVNAEQAKERMNRERRRLREERALK